MKRKLVLIWAFAALWFTTSAVLAQTPTTLRSAAKPGFLIGTAVQYSPLMNEALYNSTAALQYNTVVPENEMKFDALQPQRGVFNFTKADAIVNFAIANGMKVRGHTLIWHNQLPAWLVNGNFTQTEMRSILWTHITTVMRHFKGRITAWDVVNEAIDDNGVIRNSLWYQRVGPDYIDRAFRAARDADPAAQLFYNDYCAEGAGVKSNAVYNLVRGMKQRGVPIHGVGLQMHVTLNWYPSPTDLTANMNRLGALGLKVQITEMDVRMETGLPPTAEQLQRQADVYRTILDTCLRNTACTGLITWGFTDKYTWVPYLTGKPDTPLPFDASYAKKPAYDAILNRLLQG